MWPTSGCLVSPHRDRTPSSLVGRLSGGCAVLVEPGFPAAGDLDPFGAPGADERPKRAHEPDAPGVGQVNLPGRAVDWDEQGLHLWCPGAAFVRVPVSRRVIISRLAALGAPSTSRGSSTS